MYRSIFLVVLVFRFWAQGNTGLDRSRNCRGDNALRYTLEGMISSAVWGGSDRPRFLTKDVPGSERLWGWCSERFCVVMILPSPSRLRQ
jgi:hypothetical protein